MVFLFQYIQIPNRFAQLFNASNLPNYFNAVNSMKKDSMVHKCADFSGWFSSDRYHIGNPYNTFAGIPHHGEAIHLKWKVRIVDIVVMRGLSGTDKYNGCV